MGCDRTQWRLKIEVSYSDRKTMIENFEALLLNIRKNDFAKGGGGNSSCQYSISGPSERPLSETEISKLRKLIEETR